MTYTDQTIQILKPSQWANLPFFVLGVLLLSTGIFPAIALYRFLDFYCWSYTFGERTILHRRGIFSVTRTEVYYYRIKSVKIEEPLWMRLFGLANVQIVSSDPLQNELLLYAVPNGQGIRAMLNEVTFRRRHEENARELDMYSL